MVILTVSDDEEDLFEAIKSGAQGYLLKKLKADMFFDLLAGVTQGEAPISPLMAAKMLEEFAGRPGRGDSKQEHDGLTSRELEVLSLVAQGKTNKERAEGLVISESTAEHHLRNILDKLPLETPDQGAAYATRPGLHQPATMRGPP